MRTKAKTDSLSKCKNMLKTTSNTSDTQDMNSSSANIAAGKRLTSTISNLGVSLEASVKASKMLSETLSRYAVIAMTKPTGIFQDGTKRYSKLR